MKYIKITVYNKDDTTQEVTKISDILEVTEIPLKQHWGLIFKVTANRLFRKLIRELENE